MKILAKCPLCYGRIDIGRNPRHRHRIICPDCEAALEIVKIVPPVLDWVYKARTSYDSDKDYFFPEPALEKRR